MAPGHSTALRAVLSRPPDGSTAVAGAAAARIGLRGAPPGAHFVARSFQGELTARAPVADGLVLTASVPTSGASCRRKGFRAWWEGDGYGGRSCHREPARFFSNSGDLDDIGSCRRHCHHTRPARPVRPRDTPGRSTRYAARTPAAGSDPGAPAPEPAGIRILGQWAPLAENRPASDEATDPGGRCGGSPGRPQGVRVMEKPGAVLNGPACVRPRVERRTPPVWRARRSLRRETRTGTTGGRTPWCPAHPLRPGTCPHRPCPDAGAVAESFRTSAPPRACLDKQSVTGASPIGERRAWRIGIRPVAARRAGGSHHAP